MDPTAAVRESVSRSLRTLGSSKDAAETVSVLRTLGSFLDEGPDVEASPAERAEFRRAHYSRTLQFLLANVQADWLHGLTAAQRSELWDGLFLRGPPDQALLVLMDGFGTLRPSAGLDLLASILETFLLRGRLADLLWSYCQDTEPRLDSAQIRETLLGRVAALPELTANKLHPNTKPIFLPQQYCPLVAAGMLTALERTCLALRENKDCSLIFVAQTLGKVCIQGHSVPVFAVLAPRLSACTCSDMVWQRVCWKLLENVPQRCMESVLTGLVQAVRGPQALSRIMGNLLLKDKKAQYVLTHKLLLLQYKYETRVLRTVLGHLAADRDRRPLLLQALRAICQAWANPSAVKHTPLEQQLYVSKALLLCVGLLRDEELRELRSELLQCMLGGMQSHLDSSVVRIRHIGMVVGESLSSRLDVAGSRLTFQYERDEETLELLSLLTPVMEDEPEPKSEQEPQPASSIVGPPEAEERTQSESEFQPSQTDPASDLDSDDDLTPYDMSDDVELGRESPPRYLRDCLEALASSQDATRVELSLHAAEALVRRHVFTAREISVEMTKVLLHMEDKYSISNFLTLRQAAMVALTVVDCIPVTQYLTTEFYSMNYNLRQRLDMLEVLVMAAQELAQPITDKSRPSIAIEEIPSPPPPPDDGPAHWRQVVERRIQSKTKRISKGATRPPAEATPNRYAAMAGYFVFPLLRNYDKPQVTFDLMGSDHLVLGRLIHSLGLFMHLAVNAPVAAQMGRALLDFVWTVRYHVDQMVRRGVLFAVCAVLRSMPGPNLLVDLGEMLVETRTWLADVAEDDPDGDCRGLAVQSLVLMDKSLKKQLQGPQTPSLQA